MSDEMRMIKLIKNANVFTPEPLGKKDVLITAEKIGYIQDRIDPGKEIDIEVIDAKGMLLVPGFIDSHVHICGGGGEGGFKTRTPEIMLSDITKGGVTTVVGCLGTDESTRTIRNLIAKAKSLKEEGITCYIYTGSYHIPVRTLTDSIQDDIVLIDEIIGVGEIAVSDHRSSQPTLEDIGKIAAAARVGGMLSGKAGIVNIHIGDGKDKLSFLEHVANSTEIPITQFIPTHLGRNPGLFEAAIQYAKKGGLIDFTTSSPEWPPIKANIKCSKALKEVLDQGIPVERVSFTSDGQGSLPRFDEKGEFSGLEVGMVTSLFKEVRDAIIDEKIPVEIAITVITSNPARNLKLLNKGRVHVGKDADLVLLNENLDIDTVIARGRIMIRNKEIMVKGVFEK
ncbi:MAG TPA: beta-aspartyl-peptidase [Desulfatiglandales bacterium]|nr:beta-aspartyl-peptidase [Desulfatiglandales bacterium]